MEEKLKALQYKIQGYIKEDQLPTALTLLKHEAPHYLSAGYMLLADCYYRLALQGVLKKKEYLVNCILYLKVAIELIGDTDESIKRVSNYELTREKIANFSLLVSKEVSLEDLGVHFDQRVISILNLHRSTKAEEPEDENYGFTI